MRKSSTRLSKKHFTLPCASLSSLAIVATLLSSSPASAQEATPVKFVAQAAYPTELVRDARLSSETTKADDGELAIPISVSPNPTAGKFLISLKGNREERVRVTVTDKHGCIVDNHEVSALSNLQLGFWYYPGTYQLHITQGTSSKTIKLEKLKEE